MQIHQILFDQILCWQFQQSNQINYKSILVLKIIIGSEYHTEVTTLTPVFISQLFLHKTSFIDKIFIPNLLKYFVFIGFFATVENKGTNRKKTLKNGEDKL